MAMSPTLARYLPAEPISCTHAACSRTSRTSPAQSPPGAAWLALDGRLVLEEPERIDTDDPVFRTYLAATGDVVAARGATMLAGPLVDRATAGIDGVVLNRVVAHPVATSDAATMFALNLATIRNDPAAGLDAATAFTLESELALRRDDHRSGAITWQVRQVAIAR